MLSRKERKACHVAPPVPSVSGKKEGCRWARAHQKVIAQALGIWAQRGRVRHRPALEDFDDRFPPQLLGRLGHRSRRRGRHVEKRRLARRQAEAGLAEVGGRGQTLPDRDGGWRPRSASARRTLPGAEADPGRRTLPLPNSEKKRVDCPAGWPRGRRPLKFGMRVGVSIL